MPLPVRRSYAGAAEACTLTSNISNSATSFSITGTTTAWPSTATGPFYMVIDPGLSTEEKVLVGARTTGSLSSVTRGVDGTSAAAHDAGATCYPVLAAVDLNEANLLASTLTTKGDLLSTDGSDPKRVAVGSNNTRLVADSAQTSGIKWVADTQNTVIDAKGDLLVGSAADTVARLAVGTDGHGLIADSSATNGLSYAPLTGFRNAIINGDFSVNQRKLNSSGQVDGVALTTNQYGQDRWIIEMAGGTVTYSAQTFTVGNPITGQEPANFAQVAISGQTLSGSYAIFEQRIESVRTFAGQTITISFWAKATSGTPAVAVEIGQYFGTGGSPSAAVNTAVGKVTLSTSWARYQVSVAVPSISGKTLGTNNDHSLQIYLWCSAGSNFNSRTNSLGLQNSTLQFWGVQVEAGSVATVFERRPQQTELDLCQRYYWRFGGDQVYQYFANGFTTTTAAGNAFMQNPVPMRAVPHTLEYSTLAVSDAAVTVAVTGLTIGWNARNMTRLDFTTAAGAVTATRPGCLLTNNSASAYIAMSAELTA